MLCVLALACSSGQEHAERETGHMEPEYDQGSLERLLAKIGDINDFSRPRPLVSLEDFFIGNRDPGSIGYNLPEEVRPQEFFSLLERLRARPDVADIRIEAKDLEEPGWPSTDTIWFITSATVEEVRGWFPERMAPDEMVEGFPAPDDPQGPHPEPYEVPGGHSAIAAWYD